jgi:hypothetical protein
MIYVVDFEGYFVKNNFVIKELAYFRIEDSKTEQFLFTPPFSWSHLSFKEKQTVSYCENFLHQIRWDNGKTPYQNRLEICKGIFKPDDIIYIKGEQKQKYFKNLLPSVQKVYNLESFNCPKISTYLPQENISCSLSKHKKTLHCALYKVYGFASFVKSNVI